MAIRRSAKATRKDGDRIGAFGSSARVAVPLLLLFLFCSCAAQQPQAVGEAPVLPPSAKIDLVEVRAPAAVAVGDAAAMLDAALRRELASRDVLWSSQPGARRFTLDVEITQYEAGNAFKRWLLPGFGATVLSVRGVLKKSDGSAAGAFEHSRGVYAGGLYTVGAWHGIFDQVAADIARDLDNRIRRRGFTVALAPWSSRTVSVPSAAKRQSYSNVLTRDLRADRGRIGTREAAFGVSMGDVFFARDVTDYMTEAVTDQLRAAGHTIGASGASTVQVDLSRFWMHTDTTMLYWDVVAEIEIDIRFGVAPARRLECRSVKRTYVWPSDDLLGSVLDQCFTDLMAKLVAL